MRPQSWFYTMPLRMRSLFRRRHVERDLDDELQYHVQRKTEEYVEQGMTPKEARCAALRAMGGIEQRKEECRDAWRVGLIHNLNQDLQYGARMIRKTPGFSAVAVLTLTIGIGANTAIFSLLNAVLLEPLPYPDSDRLVQLMHFSPSWAPGQKTDSAAVPEFTVWREQKQVFQDVAAYGAIPFTVNLTGNEVPEQLRAVKVSEEYFRVFGVPIPFGRAFSPAEDRPGGRPVVMISHGLWHRRFAGDRSVVGKAVVLGGEPHIIIGVVGAGFLSEQQAELWLPLQADANSTSAAHMLRVAARLKPEVTLEQANTQMRITKAQVEARLPSRAPRDPQASFTAEPLRDAIVRDVRYALTLLFGAVTFLLLIVCANVANLLLARATVRSREMAIRTALGAARWRLVSQMLAEGLLLSAGGAALGVPLGYLGLRALIAINNGGIPRIGPQGAAVTLDGRLLAFALLTCVLTTVVFGMLPALKMSRPGAGTRLTEGSVRIGTSVRQKNARSILVIVEMAMAVVLLTGAAMLIRTLSALRAVDPGFDAGNIITMTMALNESRFQTAAAVAQLVRNAEQRVESLPGISALAATYSLPLENSLGSPFVIEGRPDDRFVAATSYVSWRYFEVFRIPLLRGRTLTEQDTGGAPPVVLVSDTLVRGSSGRYRWPSALAWGSGDPLRERITLGKNMGPPFEDQTRQVIGVVGEVRDIGLAREPQPLLYVPLDQLGESLSAMLKENIPLVWAIRTRTEPTELVGDIERELRAASGGLPVAHVRTMNQVVAESTARNRFNMVLLSIFAGMALLLAAIGVYGLMAYAVRQRTHEIGVRVALGARPADVRRMVLFEGGRLAIAGALLGVIGALALTPLLDSLVYGVKASEPSLLVFVTVLLSVATLLATWIPARRATQVDPMLALRWE